MPKLLKQFLPWTALGGWISLLAYVCLLAPTVADQGKGYTFPINNHGAIRYVTLFVYYLVFLYVPFVAIASALIQQSQWWSQRSS